VASQTVLVIDDDAVGLTAARQALGGDFEVLTASGGQEGIRVAIEKKPDIILLDIEMPGMSGYQACEILKCDTATHHTPIVFVSSSNTVRDRMLGYELGAEEFVAKPYHGEELLHRVQRISARIRAHLDLSERVDMATRTAMTAMAGNSELGVAMQFVEASYSLSTITELAMRMLRTLDSLGMTCALLFNTTEGARFFCTRGEMKPMEEELMLAIHGQGLRIHDFGCRTQVNYSRVALLVKNMPLEDRDRYGRLKDLFPVMLGAADARLRSLETENALLSQSQDLARSFKIVESTLKEQSSSMSMTQAQVASVVRSLWKEFEAKLPTLGLDDDQEHYLMAHIERALQETQDAMEHSESLQGSFDSVMRLFKHLTERQQKIVDEFMRRPEAVAPVSQPQESVDSGADIELF
jgi:DNA-binding response OmpR family regulator